MTDEQKAYELIINQTSFKPRMFGTLTYSTRSRPGRFSLNPASDFFEFGIAVARYFGRHIILYGGIGHDHHFHFIINFPEKFQFKTEHCLDVERLWTKGIKSVVPYDHSRPGAWYTLKQHDVFDASLNKVFCPKTNPACRGRKGCLLERKKGLLKPRTDRRY